MFFLFTYKKDQFDVESKSLFNELKKTLKLKSLKKIKVLNRYLVNNISEQNFKKTINTIFCEPMVDEYYLNKIPNLNKYLSFGVDLLPEQFSQRDQAIKSCFFINNIKPIPFVKSSKIYLLNKDINSKELQKIKKYLINPIDSKEITIYFDKYQNNFSVNKKIPIIKSFTKFSLKQLESFKQDFNLSMSINDLLMLQKYFQKIKRQPTETEIRIFDTYWSDHCRHTTFNSHITKIDINSKYYNDLINNTYHKYLSYHNEIYPNNSHPITLMNLATINAKYLKKHNLIKNLDISDEINACSIKADVKTDKGNKKYLVMFKNETHNHPTEIEPYGGASTCLGGAIRDPLSGRTYVYQAMRVTGSADPTVDIDKTLPNKLPQKTITTKAADGYSAYGNQIGLATGQVNELYDPSYVAKRLETGAVIAANEQKNVYRNKPKAGDVIILLGGRTGKDGIGGATGSSKQQKKDSLKTAITEVQKGNPVEERKIMRLFRNPAATKLIIRCNDFGAGGVSVAIGELCDGIDINLDLVRTKYQGLTGTELAISESQERMAVVVSKSNAKKFINLAKEENLEAYEVAKVTNTNKLRMYWNKKLIVDIDRDFLNTNGATQQVTVKIENNQKISFPKLVPNLSSVEKKLHNLNADLKLGLVQKFDSTIGRNTVLMPFGGVNQLTPIEGMVAKIPTFDYSTSSTVSSMTYGFNPFLSLQSEFHMGYYAVVESLDKQVALGADFKNTYLSFQEYFMRLNNEPKKWGSVFSTLLGAFKAQSDLGLGAIGGKDSMSGTFEKIDVIPTLISFAVNVYDLKNVVSNEFKKVKSSVVLLKTNRLNDDTLDSKQLIKNYQFVNKLIKSNKVLSVSTIKSNGVIESIAKSCLGNNIGFKFSNKKINLFEPMYGSFIIELPDNLNYQTLFKNTNYELLGKTIIEQEIVHSNFNVSLDKTYKYLTDKIKNVFPFELEQEDKKINIPQYKANKRIYYPKKVAHPIVVIPVFNGTNCEFDSQKAFVNTPTIVKQVLINNINEQELKKSINKLVQEINKAHIIFFPGGFSAADEPDGSAKYIVNIFQNKKIKDAVNKFVDRKCLIIGICNGFQALIKLGLISHGKIVDMSNDMPTLTYNDINHHMSQIVRTKLCSNKSPWLANLKPGDVLNVAISHGEGKLVASQQYINKWIKNGQIAFQYVDLNNQPTMKMPYNPNGSNYAIECLTSENGLILGKMGHSERYEQGLYKNIPGNFDSKIFISGIEYFTQKKCKK